MIHVASRGGTSPKPPTAFVLPAGTPSPALIAIDIDLPRLLAAGLIAALLAGALLALNRLWRRMPPVAV